MIQNLPLDVLRHVMLRFTNAQTVKKCSYLHRRFFQIFRDYVVKRIHDPSCDYYNFCRRNPDTMVALLELHQTRIKALRICDLPFNQFGPIKTWGAFERISMLEHLNLKKLTLNDCHSHFLKSFLRCTSLTSLNLKFADFTQAQPEDMSLVAASFKKLQSLQLDLSNYKPMPNQPKFLKYLMTSTSLEHLRFSLGCPLRDALSPIQANTRLTSLFISLQGLAIEPQALAQLLQMKWLTSLTLSKYVISDGSFESIVTKLTLRELNLGLEGNLKSDLWTCVNKCTSLVFLHLGHSVLKESDFTRLQGLSYVTRLSITSSFCFSNTAINHVRTIPTLRRLDVNLVGRTGVCYDKASYGPPATKLPNNVLL